MTQFDGGSNDVVTYRFKRRTVRDRLQPSYLVYVNAPDPAHNSLGYLVYGGPQPVHVRLFENFAVFCVGGTAADVREADDYLDIFAHEVHHEWSSADYHAVQAARYMRQVLRMTHNGTSDMEMIAAEFIFVDYAGRAHTVRFDGSQRDVVLGPERFLLWVGSHGKEVRKDITRIINELLPDEKVMSPQFPAVEERLREEYDDIRNVLVRSVSKEPAR